MFSYPHLFYWPRPAGQLHETDLAGVSIYRVFSAAFYGHHFSTWLVGIALYNGPVVAYLQHHSCGIFYQFRIQIVWDYFPACGFFIYTGTMGA